MLHDTFCHAGTLCFCSRFIVLQSFKKDIHWVTTKNTRKLRSFHESIHACVTCFHRNKTQWLVIMFLLNLQDASSENQGLCVALYQRRIKHTLVIIVNALERNAAASIVFKYEKWHINPKWEAYLFFSFYNNREQYPSRQQDPVKAGEVSSPPAQQPPIPQIIKRWVLVSVFIYLFLDL